MRVVPLPSARRFALQPFILLAIGLQLQATTMKLC
jgi:hypothetical protein